MSDTEKKQKEFTNRKFKVKLIKDYIFETVTVKGKEVKRSLDKKVIYPFDK